MGHQYAKLAFTPSVQKVQKTMRSRDNYVAMEQGEDVNYLLSDQEANFIRERDSFYMATVSETGWPYVQHRGGAPGFMKVIDEQTIGFADFSGNRQYISAGNLTNDNRVSLIFMDYLNRTRLKVLGRVRLVSDNEYELMAKLEVDDYRARVERGFLIHVEAFDWNCPQHITPRYSEAQLQEIISPLVEENKVLKERQSVSFNPSRQPIGNGPLRLVITGVRQLAPLVRAFELRDPDGKALPEIEAGSHIQVPVSMGDGETMFRYYSICSNPARRDIYEIAVLNKPEGQGGSSTIHETYYLGLMLRCEYPDNHFNLHEDNRPAVLIAGGIGITPIKPMAQSLRARKASLVLHYTGRSIREMAFRDRLQREFGPDIKVYQSNDGEKLDVQKVLSSMPDNAVVYVCGPGSLIDAVVASAEKLQIERHRIRFERFFVDNGPNVKPIDVELRRSKVKLTVRAEQSVLDAMLDAGIDASYSCRTGTCKSCAVRVIDGEPEHKDDVLTTEEKEQHQLMCPCVSRAKTDYLVLDV